MVRVGDEAPDFELPVHVGGTFRLSEHRGRSNVVLYFYPADFTLGCTKEACSFQKQISSLRQSNAVVVGISPDDLETHRRFAQSFGLEFLLASDPLKKVIRQYGALWLGGLLVKRITFVIDMSGVVRGMIHHEFQWQRHSEDVRALLQTLS
jgi:peroxiredoxin Q/BCP